MFPIKKQKAFAAVGHHFPLYDNDIRNIKICWLFPIPDFNTGLCQCGSLKISSKDLQQKRAREKSRGEESSGFTAAGSVQI